MIAIIKVDVCLNYLQQKKYSPLFTLPKGLTPPQYSQRISYNCFWSRNSKLHKFILNLSWNYKNSLLNFRLSARIVIIAPALVFFFDYIHVICSRECKKKWYTKILDPFALYQFTNFQNFRICSRFDIIFWNTFIWSNSFHFGWGNEFWCITFSCTRVLLYLAILIVCKWYQNVFLSICEQCMFSKNK